VTVNGAALKQVIDWHNIWLAIANTAKPADFATSDEVSRFRLAQHSSHGNTPATGFDTPTPGARFSNDLSRNTCALVNVQEEGLGQKALLGIFSVYWVELLNQSALISWWANFHASFGRNNDCYSWGSYFSRLPNAALVALEDL
jgi:hypothetical protein